MLKFYHVKYTTIHNHTEIGVAMFSICIEESEKPELQNISINWSNLNEMEKKYFLGSRFVIHDFKKRGRAISFSRENWTMEKRNDFKNVYEKSGKELNVVIQIEYTEYNPTINEVLKYGDGEKAIKYLVERGLSIAK